ncbi:cytochrome P450 [Aurantimonas sp. HBX-1]|uniref:cytochrome P450 n=1 Tax=Aurantimonas sp. HBX-1 TaxID=2906072 RepID=UPI001F2E1DDB|nr:cytochrome P450 [Aurantimonas sp. HBX-1]UIJ73999.1 cytochrome P450 [Aurantimonas sp. HBX-1]
MSRALPRRFDVAGGVLRLDPGEPDFYEDPYPSYGELHRHGGIARWAETGSLAVAGHATVAALLRDRRFGRILPAGPDGRPDYRDMPAHLADFYAIESCSLLDLEPPTHTRLRSLVTRAFVSRRIERLAPRIGEIADELIDGFAADGTVELVEAFATPLPVRVIAELIGVPAADAPLLVDWSHRMVAMYRLGRTRAVEESANAAARDFATYLRTVIAEKRRRPADDLVSALIAAESDGGRLDEAEMVATLVLLLNAGHEATVHQIGNAVKAILESGQDPATLFCDVDSTAATVEECLRFDTPLHLFERVALESVTLAEGWQIERGGRVALLLGAANHDPSVFERPGEFAPGRPARAHVSFGGGIHFCIGAPLARLELAIALGTLFRRLPDLSIAAAPHYRDSWHFRGLERLELRFRPQGTTLKP